MSIDEAIKELEGHEANVRFQRLLAICIEFFGQPRINGSHYIFSTPWRQEIHRSTFKIKVVRLNLIKYAKL